MSEENKKIEMTKQSGPQTSRATIKQRIMRRVYFFFMLRNIAPLAFDCLLIVAAVFIITLFVSVRDVMANFSTASGGGSISAFSISAIAHTKIQNKVLLLIMGVVGFFAIRDLKRAVRAVRTLRENAGGKRKS